MLKRIPAYFIQELTQRTDLVSLIGAKVELKKKSGGNYWGCCPFHEEKTPSFSVSDSKQFYHCFGCKAGGDAIRFLMDFDNLTFTESVEALARFNGMEVPYELIEDNRQAHQIQSQQTAKQKNEQVLVCLSKIAQWFHQQLLLPQGQEARRYLGQRGLKKSDAVGFLLGYAPTDNALKTAIYGELGQEILAALPAHKNGADSASSANKVGVEKLVEWLIELGLLKTSDGGRCYDFFRDRLIFPIRNVKGQVIAFGARALGQAKPKYLNSIESTFFEKRRELYGLFEAMQGKYKGRQLLVTEGYIDVVKLAQQGFTFAVAALGTAISEEHIRQLSRRADKVWFAFDGDSSGHAAAERALEAIFAQYNGKVEQVEWRFAFLPTDEDPDSLLTKTGVQAMQDVLDASITPSQFLLRLLDDGLNGRRSVEAQMALLRQAELWLGKLPDSQYRHSLQRAISQAFSLQELPVPAAANPVAKKAVRTKQVLRFTTTTNGADLRLLAMLMVQPELAKESNLGRIIQTIAPMFYAAAYRLRAVEVEQAFELVGEEVQFAVQGLLKDLSSLSAEALRQEFDEMLEHMVVREQEKQARLEKLKS